MNKYSNSTWTAAHAMKNRTVGKCVCDSAFAVKVKIFQVNYEKKV